MVTYRRGSWTDSIRAVERIALIGELARFIRGRRLYWLAPTLIALVVVGLLLVAAEGSAIAPFIYPLF